MSNKNIIALLTDMQDKFAQSADLEIVLNFKDLLETSSCKDEDIDDLHQIVFGLTFTASIDDILKQNISPLKRDIELMGCVKNFYKILGSIHEFFNEFIACKCRYIPGYKVIFKSCKLNGFIKELNNYNYEDRLPVYLYFFVYYFAYDLMQLNYAVAHIRDKVIIQYTQSRNTVLELKKKSQLFPFCNSILKYFCGAEMSDFFIKESLSNKLENVRLYFHFYSEYLIMLGKYENSKIFIMKNAYSLLMHYENNYIGDKTNLPEKYTWIILKVKSFMAKVDKHFEYFDLLDNFNIQAYVLTSIVSLSDYKQVVNFLENFELLTQDATYHFYLVHYILSGNILSGNGSKFFKKHIYETCIKDNFPDMPYLIAMIKLCVSNWSDYLKLELDSTVSCQQDSRSLYEFFKKKFFSIRKKEFIVPLGMLLFSLFVVSIFWSLAIALYSDLFLGIAIIVSGSFTFAIGFALYTLYNVFKQYSLSRQNIIRYDAIVLDLKSKYRIANSNLKLTNENVGLIDNVTTDSRDLRARRNENIM